MLVVITLILWCPPSSPPLQQSSDSHCTVLYTLYTVQHPALLCTVCYCTCVTLTPGQRMNRLYE